MAKILKPKIQVNNEINPKRELEVCIFLNWIQIFYGKDWYNHFIEHKHLLPSLSFRFYSSTIDEFDFILLFKLNNRNIFLIIEVEKQSHMSDTQINECIEIKEKKLNNLISTINNKNKENGSFEIRTLVIIEQAQELHYKESSKGILSDLLMEAIILDKIEIETFIFSLFNKAVSVASSIKSIFEKNFIVPNFIIKQMWEIDNFLLQDSQYNILKINGSPGSGKTIISTLIYKNLIDNEKKVGYYSLVKSIVRNTNKIIDSSNKYVNNFIFGAFGKKSFNWQEFKNFDFIIVDEQQRLFKNQSSLFFQNLKNGCKVILVGDEDQKINPSEVGFIIPITFKVKEHKFDSTLLRYTANHIEFLKDFLLYGKLENKNYNSNLNFEFKLFHPLDLPDNKLGVVHIYPYEENVASNGGGSPETTYNYGPLLYQGDELDVVILHLENLSIEKINKNEIKFNPRNFRNLYYINNDVKIKEIPIDDSQTKKMLYCAVTRATQKIIIIGTEEMKIYFETGINILKKNRK